ncbi:MAG: YaiI/YqxD family protein, partial [Planctomycetota bacterium]|nr:YaiI/YqxD family protein [Planctomycetota bacterium]
MWVDADACPVTIKEVLYRAAKKRQVLTTFVANQGLRLPASEFLKSILVTTGL